MKKEGRMGKEDIKSAVTSQKDKLRARGKLNIPSPKDMSNKEGKS